MTTTPLQGPRPGPSLDEQSSQAPAPAPLATVDSLPPKARRLAAKSEDELARRTRRLGWLARGCLGGCALSLSIAIAGVGLKAGWGASLNLSPEALFIGVFSQFPLSMALMIVGLCAYEDWRKSRPLSAADPETQIEAARLIKSCPPARAVADLARAQGRSLRGFDLDSMAEAERREATRRAQAALKRIGGRL